MGRLTLDFAVRTRKRPSLSEGLCKEPTLHFTESRSIRIPSDGHMALRVERNVTDPSTLLQPYKRFSRIRLRQSVFDVSRLSRKFKQLLIMLRYSKTAGLSFYRWQYFYRSFQISIYLIHRIPIDSFLQTSVALVEIKLSVSIRIFP